MYSTMCVWLQRSSRSVTSLTHLGGHGVVSQQEDTALLLHGRGVVHEQPVITMLAELYGEAAQWQLTE